MCEQERTWGLKEVKGLKGRREEKGRHVGLEKILGREEAGRVRPGVRQRTGVY